MAGTLAYVGLLSLLMYKLTIAAYLIALLVPAFAHATTTSSINVPHVARVYCQNDGDPYWITGSAVVVSKTHLLTNAHVVTDGATYYDWCFGFLAPNAYSAPTESFALSPIGIGRFDDTFDYAFMEAVDGDGSAYHFASWATLGNADALMIGDATTLLGYPSSGGDTITITHGELVGYSGRSIIKTSALADAGSSGGGMFDESGSLVGITTAVTTGTYRGGYTLAQNINAILEDAFGPEVAVRDYDALYASENVFCFDAHCYNRSASEYQIASEDTGSDEGTPEESLGAKYNPAKHDQALVERLKGYILLQVEEHGEAWYVRTDDGLRYYIRNGDVAYDVMRYFSLGITDRDLADVPAVDSTSDMLAADSVCATNALANRLRGKILLQVEQHGEAWYVHPDTCRRIYLKDGAAAYRIMQFLSLGISNDNLEKLPSGTLSP